MELWKIGAVELWRNVSMGGDSAMGCRVFISVRKALPAEPASRATPTHPLVSQRPAPTDAELTISSELALASRGAATTTLTYNHWIKVTAHTFAQDKCHILGIKKQGCSNAVFCGQNIWHLCRDNADEGVFCVSSMCKCMREMSCWGTIASPS